jgi:hypothetical protein
MSDLDAVLARARRPGRFVATRRFTLARDKAIEKMRAYTLRSRDQYVLELIQAAVLAGARYVAVDLRSNRETVGWVGGNPYTAEQLEGLLDFLFVDQTVRETRHVQQLAVGVNALLQAGVTEVTVESGDGAAATRLTVTPTGNVQVGSASGFSGTYVSAAHTSWWSVTAPPDPRRVYNTLIDKAGWCPVPLLLNDGAVFGYTGRAPPPALGARRVLVQGPEQAPPGVLDFVVVGRLSVVVGGVLIRDQKASPWVGQLRMTVHDDNLRKTADMGDIVEDDAWVEMLHATRPLLVQGHERHAVPWKPPLLPRITRTKAGAAPVVTTVPAPTHLRQAGHRAPIPLGAVYTMGAGEPLFWVDLATANTLGPLLDPHHFPWRVLVITPAEAEAIQALDLPVTLSRLTAPSDVAFVRSALERGHGDPTVEVHRSGFRAVVHLPASPPRRWDPRGTGDAIAGVLDGKLAVLLASPVDLGGCCVELHPETGPLPTSEPETLAALALAAAGIAAGRSPSLAARLILAHARPHLFHDGPIVRLDVRWPPGWETLRETLLDTPLTAQSPPLTLRRWLAILHHDPGAPSTWSVPDLKPFEALEARLGAGALVGPTPGEPLVLLARRPGGWRTLLRGTAPPPDASELLGFYPTPAVPEPPKGFASQVAPIPGLAWYVAENTAPVAGSSPWRALHDALATAARDATPRGAAWLTLASVRLAVAFDLLSEARLPAHPFRLLPVVAVLRGDGPPVVAREGVAVDGPEGPSGAGSGIGSWLPIDLPLARTLAPLCQKPLHLLVDDPPTLWETPDPAAWLVRVPVVTPTAHGWLGLRRTFDPTPAILKVQGLTTSLWTSLVERLPAHGCIHIHRGEPPLADVVLAGLALYAELREGLESGRFLGDDLVSARAHAAAAVGQAARLGLDSSIVRGLAPFAEGGDLLLPELPGPAVDLREGRLAALQSAIAAGLRAAHREHKVRIVDRSAAPYAGIVRPGEVAVDLPASRARVQAAERGDTEALLLLAVEVGLTLHQELPALDLGAFLRGALGALAIRA